MTTVHHLKFSRSTRVLWLLEELGLDYELKAYDRDQNFRAPAELSSPSARKSARGRRRWSRARRISVDPAISRTEIWQRPPGPGGWHA
ncbi:hypothetical protein Q4F19_07935 [Sphingomonas sp. BIUV-7]|uniref:GST N-terminal domain-containing protein n=1 Tax=Sphingomonas natans TaxID=3063330 RepID=A0ABT8Y7L0_9SPHN|nr:hypothetical protein [Sphingomonas sp. BIUV-7]MDO6414309.1 hypothetical protein [Sphingomonas sp. BIUV-7]